MPDPHKIQGVLDLPTPKSVRNLHGFLGLLGFYRRFMRNYATMACPLTSLLKKNAFDRTSATQLAFDQLKIALGTTLILSLSDFTIPFVVQTDASGQAMGVVLLQGDRPIAYFSKIFCPRLSKASTYIRELHAITSAVKRLKELERASYSGYSDA